MVRTGENISSYIPPALKGGEVLRNLMQEIAQSKPLSPTKEKPSPAGDVLVGIGAVARWNKLKGVYEYDGPGNKIGVED